jgi:diguanylate cyclase (GGDEF)-like protein
VTDFALRLSPAANHASVRLACDDQLGVSSGAGVEMNAAQPVRRRRNTPLAWVAQKDGAAQQTASTVDPPAGSLVSVPIRARGTTLGVLSLSSEACNAFSDEDEVLARLLAQAAAQALITAELEQRVITDAQTLAFNRGYLFTRLNQEMELARARGGPLSVLLMDLDHFKRVNDEHGHPIGDALLRAFADRVRSVVRSTDVLVRRGGEEFVLIMPATRECFAAGVAERLRREVCGSPFTLHDAVQLRATISIGVASWDGRESGEALDARADRAMYEAKQLGRNRTVRCTGPRHNLQLCSSHS